MILDEHHVVACEPKELPNFFLQILVMSIFVQLILFPDQIGSYFETTSPRKRTWLLKNSHSLPFSLRLLLLMC